VGTLGGKAAVTGAIKQVGKAAVKEGLEVAGKEAIKGTTTGVVKEAEKGLVKEGTEAVGKEGSKAAGETVTEAAKQGRSGKQKRLRELAEDPNTSSADSCWIKQDAKEIEAGKRKNIRNPPGKEMAHERGREAAKGYDYSHSQIQDKDLHKTQHKYDDFGRANKERPVKKPGEN